MEEMFIGMEAGVFVGIGELCLLTWRMCVYWRGGGVFIGFDEVCLLGWRRCAF